MQLKEVVQTLERFAPLPLQESYDNAGLQIGLPEGHEVSGVLLCLDVTEDVIQEAASMGCNLIVSHHPLLFRSPKSIDDSTYVTRCIRQAIVNGIGIYSAHTNLDNAKGGVNWEIAQIIGLEQVHFLQPIINGSGGSGAIGILPEAEPSLHFLNRLKSQFKVDSLLYSKGKQELILRVALCGGAGDFLIEEAAKQKADIFITGEIGYHHFFGHERNLWLAALGHYQSEQFTIKLLHQLLAESLLGLNIVETNINTNPIHSL